MSADAVQPPPVWQVRFKDASGIGDVYARGVDLPAALAEAVRKRLGIVLVHCVQVAALNAEEDAQDKGHGHPGAPLPRA